MKYKYLYKTVIFLLFLALFIIIVSTSMLAQELNLEHLKWVLYSSSLVIFASSVVIVFFRPQSSEALRLNYREEKINEEQEKLQQLQKEYDANVSLLAQKENEVKQKLIQYQQYIEFPDENQSSAEENNEYFNDEIAELLHDKAEIIFDKIITKKYTEQEEFKHSLLLEDIVDLIESVARVHHPDSEHPLLETSIENLLRSLNRLSLHLLVLVDSFPINIKEYNLRKTYLYIQKSATTIGYYKKAEPFLTFAAPVLRIGMAANPMIGIAQTAAIEVGKHVIQKSSEKYALKLLHDVIEIIGEQASTIFGEESLRYRSKHWIYALELVEIIHHFTPVEAEALAKVMKIINGLSMRSEYDRVFVYHCLAQAKSANPESYANDFVTEEDKQEIVSKLKRLIEKTINKDRTEEIDKKVKSWRIKVESRLGVEIQLNIDRNDADYLRNMLSFGSPEKKIKPFLARYILTLMEDGETPQFIYTAIHCDADFQTLEGQELWLIGSNKRLMLLGIEKEDKITLLWEYYSGQQPSLSLQRVSRVVADDCKLIGGTWHDDIQTGEEACFILEGKKMTSYDSYFRVLDDFKRILA